jgi:hypothetical protein
MHRGRLRNQGGEEDSTNFTNVATYQETDKGLHVIVYSSTSSTAETIVEKLSSARIMSAASFGLPPGNTHGNPNGGLLERRCRLHPQRKLEKGRHQGIRAWRTKNAQKTPTTLSR